MKFKKILFLAIPTLIAGLAGCDEKVDNSGGGNPGNIPTEEGKVTLTVNLTDETNVTDNEYTSMWITGGFNGWLTGEEASELINLEGTNTWYTIVDEWDTTIDAGLEAMVMLGYKSGEINAGLIWANGDQYKAVPYNVPAGPNMTFTVEDGVGNLGDVSFSAKLPEPIENISFTPSITFKETLPDYVNVYIRGSFLTVDGVDGWNIDQVGASTLTSDHKTFYLKQSVTARPDSEVVFHIILTNQAPIEGESSSELSYDYAYKFDSREGEGGNADSVLVTLDDNNSILSLSDDLEMSTLPPDPSALPLESFTTNITLAEGVTFTNEPAYYVVGNYNQWGNPTVSVTSSDTGFSFTLTEEDITSPLLVGSSLEFKIAKVNDDGSTNWDTGIGLEGGANIVIPITAATMTANIEIYSADTSLYARII